MPAAEIRYATAPVPGLVSIVIPCHNSDRLLGETLESIGRQSYRDWELWVVEDATRDNTEQIVREFARKFPGNRVEYRRNDHRPGPSATRNVAFHEVNGEFVALVDSDDVWLPDHLDEAIEALGARDLDIVYSTVLMFEDETRRPMAPLGPSEAEEKNFEKSMFARSLVVPSATVLRRQVLADVGEWETSLRYCEDYEYWMRAIVAGKRFGHIGGLHCLYRKGHQEAATKNMAAILTTFARVSSSFLDAPIPAVPHKTRRKLLADVYRLASTFHWRGDPKSDRSVDPRQAAALSLQAWRMRPKRVRLLARAAWQFLVTPLRAKPAALPPTAVATHRPASEPARRAA
jgi:GT2 family glycosyltransferase